MQLHVKISVNSLFVGYEQQAECSPN